MTTKTTPSGRALEDIDQCLEKEPDGYGHYLDESLARSWLNDNEAAIRTALLRSHAIEEYPVSSGSEWNDAVKHTIERLKGIGHDDR